MPRISLLRTRWLWGALLACLTIAAHAPALRADFFWDDYSTILDNPVIEASDGLHRIWLTTQPIDYYPLTLSLIWIERRAFGAHAVGYHIVNLLLHGIAAFLVWRMLERLEVPRAWFSAAVFAVHPVNVTSVAWASEVKNTLSGALAFLTVLLWIRCRERAGRPRGAPQGRARPESRRTRGGRAPCLAMLAAFLAALLAKSAVAMLPAVLLLVAYWRDGRWSIAELRRTAPMFALSLALGLVTVWFQYERALGGIAARTDGLPARLALAGRALLWFAGSLLWPADRTLVYQKWTADPASLGSWIPLAICVVAIGAAAVSGRPSGRAFLAGLGGYAVALLPVLGFLDQGFYRFAYVADHWQYIAMVSAVAWAVGAASVLMEWPRTGSRMTAGTGRSGMREREREPAPFAGAAPGSGRGVIRLLPTAAGAIVLVLLAAQSFRYGTIFSDQAEVWRDNIRKNAAAWIAESNLASVLRDRGDQEGAIEHFERALWIEPRAPEVLNSYGNLLAARGETDRAAELQRRALAIRPDDAQAHQSLGNLAFRSGRYDEALASYLAAARSGPLLAGPRVNAGNALLALSRPEEAAASYREALRLRPGFAPVHVGLGNALATLGNLRDAAASFELALSLDPSAAEAQYGLGNIAALERRYDEARRRYRIALSLQPGYAQARRNLEALPGP